MFQSVHHDSKERGGDRISLYESHMSHGSRDSGSSLAPPMSTKRGVSPTPLGNLKVYQHSDTGKGKHFLLLGPVFVISIKLFKEYFSSLVLFVTLLGAGAQHYVIMTTS